MKNLGKAILLCMGDFMVFGIASAICFVLQPFLPKNIADQVYFDISFVLFIIILYGLYKMAGSNLIEECRFKKVNKNIILKVIILGICFQFISEVITNLSINILHINNLSYDEVQKTYSEIKTSWFGYASILIFAPILEEILNRGIILRQCLRYISPIWAIIIQAIFFGLGHGNTIQFMYTFVGGLFLGYIAYSTKSIIPCIIMHFTVNLTDVLFNSFVQSMVALYLPIIALISIGIVAYITYTIKINSKHTLSSYSK